MTPCFSHRPLNLPLIDLLLRGREWLLRFFFFKTGFSLLAAASVYFSPSPTDWWQNPLSWVTSPSLQLVGRWWAVHYWWAPVHYWFSTDRTLLLPVIVLMLANRLLYLFSMWHFNLFSSKHLASHFSHWTVVGTVHYWFWRLLVWVCLPVIVTICTAPLIAHKQINKMHIPICILTISSTVFVSVSYLYFHLYLYLPWQDRRLMLRLCQ